VPELPEVETTRRGISPHLVGRRITGVVVRDGRLRWPVTENLQGEIRGTDIESVDRRGKYLVITTSKGVLLLHLGMSGSLRIQSRKILPRKHDHVDIQLDSGQVLRFHDPRRFGCVLWLGRTPLEDHPLLKDLGPEPLSCDFDGEYLLARSRHRRVAIKNFIMNSRVVVGVGNIYASESLFLAGIRPGKAAGKLSRARCHLLVSAIQDVLNSAIEAGGTTLRDFVREDGNPGYFANELKVYGREGQPCLRCSSPIRSRKIGQRSTFYCVTCQK
jgi:formamidopyrimidine-DNA glycosylase